MLGIYESRSDHSAGNHPTGEATVLVDRPGPVVLVLSSYEPTHWTIAVMPGAAVERIVLNGYYQQTASAPAGIPIDDRSSYQSWLGSYGYAWPDNTGGGNTANLIMRSEGLAGTCLASFHGCYRATQFSLGAPAPSTGWTAFAFQSAPTVQTPCTGPRYIRYLPAYDEWVGVSLCSPLRYKLFLGVTPSSVFYEIGDYAGHGQDHCELVNPGFRIPDEDDITSGGCASCSIDSAHVFDPPVGSSGWARSRFGEPFTFVESWPMYNLYTAQWYECGVTVP